MSPCESKDEQDSAQRRANALATRWVSDNVRVVHSYPLDKLLSDQSLETQTGAYLGYIDIQAPQLESIDSYERLYSTVIVMSRGRIKMVDNGSLC